MHGKIKISPFRIAALLFCLFLFTLLIIKPQTYINSAKDGLLLFCVNVLPALFPFFFLSTFLTKLGAAKYVARLGEKPFRALFNAPPAACYLFLMSVLSGYPVGAKLILDFYQGGMLSSDEAKRCAAFSSTSNPVFLIGTVGAVMLKDLKLGAVILVSHYLSALLNGLIFRARKPSAGGFAVIFDNAADDILYSSITSAVASILAAGGFITVFNIFHDALSNCGVINLFSNAFSWLMPREISSVLFSGAIEMTRGCYLVSRAEIWAPLKAALCAAIVSFGGLTVFAQNYSFLSRCKVKPLIIGLQKLCHSLLAFVVCFLISLIFFR